MKTSGEAQMAGCVSYLRDSTIAIRLIRIRHEIYEIARLGALLSEVMRRLRVVRSEGEPPACAQNRVACKKANPYE